MLHLIAKCSDVFKRAVCRSEAVLIGRHRFGERHNIPLDVSQIPVKGLVGHWRRGVGRKKRQCTNRGEEGKVDSVHPTIIVHYYGCQELLLWMPRAMVEPRNRASTCRADRLARFAFRRG